MARAAPGSGDTGVEGGSGMGARTPKGCPPARLGRSSSASSAKSSGQRGASAQSPSARSSRQTSTTAGADRPQDASRPASARTSAGAPQATRRPERITSSRSQRAASSMSWVTATTAPCPRSPSMTWMTSDFPSSSSMEVASSRTSTSGEAASAPAMATRCCWPPERSCTSRSSLPASPTWARARTAASRASDAEAPKFRGAKATSSPTTLETNWFSGLWNTIWQRRRSSCTSAPGLSSMPATSSEPRCRGSSALRWRASVVLPLPFAPTIATNSPSSTEKETSSSAGAEASS